MSHVTNLTLEEAEARMSELVRIRQARIERAEAEIKEANRQFDAHAKPLGLEINRLRAQRESHEPASPSQPRTTAAKPVILDGLTEEEQQHYRELLAKKG